MLTLTEMEQSALQWRAKLLQASEVVEELGGEKFWTEWIASLWTCWRWRHNNVE